MKRFALSGTHGRFLRGRLWSASGSMLSVHIDDRLRTAIYSNSASPVYLVCAGTAADFKRLSSGAGILAAPGSTLSVDSDLECTGDLKVMVVVVEYDAEGIRLNATDIPVGQATSIALSERTERVLVTLRIVGSGSLVCRYLDVTSLNQQDQNCEPRYERAWETAQVALAEAAAELANARTDLANIRSLDEGVVASTEPTSKTGAALASAYHAMLETLADELPKSSGSHHFGKIPLRVAIITDIYMFNFYKDVFEDVVYLSPDNCAAVLRAQRPQLVLFVSCWRGIEGDDWQGLTYRASAQEALDTVVEWAFANSVPTVFQSIEDPSNFEHFIEVARRFDYVFTSDVDCIERYKDTLGHDRVFWGAYGANPQVNNPVGSHRHDMFATFFAGSYPERYRDRVDDMCTLFDSVLTGGTDLLIADRNLELDGYDYPARYQPYVMGPFDHEILQAVHKLFRYSVNFNSIKGSPTMSAMRIYELQAQGKPLLSNYARSAFHFFPEMRLIPYEDHHLMLGDPRLEHVEFALAECALQTVMDQFISYRIVSDLCSRLGLSASPERSSRFLIVGVGDEHASRAVASRLGSVDSVDFDFVYANGVALEDLSIPCSDYGYVAVIDPEIRYDDGYLRSRLNAFKYTDVAYVTQEAKFTHGVYQDGRIHEYTKEAPDPALTVYSTEYFDVEESLSGHSIGTGYIADPYHVGFRDYLSTEFGHKVTMPKLSVIVPVFNNGKYLLRKMLPSLLRSGMRSDMEVVIVDDGSTDPETLSICQWLGEAFDNVTLFAFDDGGSGSASRPRNKGIELARGRWLAFLDPDNEISGNGYLQLVELAESQDDLKIACGFQVKVGATNTITGRHAVSRTSVVDDFREAFPMTGKFPVVSTQAAVIDRAWLRNTNVRFVEGAVGQDTLFGWEVCLEAERVAFTDSAHLLYYAERNDSVTNDISLGYFERALVLEREQVKILQKHQILQEYVDHHLEQFLTGWYYPRIERLPESDRQAGRALVAEIENIYVQTSGAAQEEQK